MDPAHRVILMDQFENAKKLYNRAVFLSRKFYFNSKDILRYERCYSMVKDSDEYKWLNSNVAQHVLKEVDGSFRAFGNLLKQAKLGRFNYHNIVLPGYLEEDRFVPLIVSQARLTDDNEMIFPLSRKYKSTLRPLTIPIPPMLYDKKIVRAIVSRDDRFNRFKVAYEYQVETSAWTLDRQHVLAIDLGVNNMAACVTNHGESFIVSGRRLKSRAQWFNTQYFNLKEIAETQIREDEKEQFVPIQVPTRRMRLLWKKFNFQINDEFSKAARYIVEYCLENDIGTVVVGEPNAVELYRNDPSFFATDFIGIPLGRFRHKIADQCERYQIDFRHIDESYTSEASFFDGDEIPDYNDDNPKKYAFSGKRTSRGEYQTRDGKLVNSDVNAALNILKKADVVDVSPLVEEGQVKMPKKVLLP